MRVNKLMFSPDKTEILFVEYNSILGSDITPVLYGVSLPLKLMLAVWASS